MSTTAPGKPATHDHAHHHDHGHHHHPHEHGEHAHHAVPPGKTVSLLYIDPVAGASGDMFLGALVDLGADFEQLRADLRKLNIAGFDLVRHDVKRHTIACTKVDVVVEDVPHPHRHVGDLLKIVNAAELPARVKERSAKILTRLAEAESAAHKMPVEKVHLHEVGGLDCLVDVVGTCLALEMLGVERIYSGPVAVGTGHVACAHGRMPLPAPGTLALLRDFPIRKTTFEGEMTTPTGAAIIVTLAKPVIEALTFLPKKIGHGAGSKDKSSIANFLRLIIAEIPIRCLSV